MFEKRPRLDSRFLAAIADHTYHHSFYHQHSYNHSYFQAYYHAYYHHAMDMPPHPALSFPSTQTDHSTLPTHASQPAQSSQAAQPAQATQPAQPLQPTQALQTTQPTQTPALTPADLPRRQGRAVRIRKAFLDVSRTLTTPQLAANYFLGIGTHATSLRHALAHFVHLMATVHTWQYAEVWRLETGCNNTHTHTHNDTNTTTIPPRAPRVALDAYFIVVDPLEVEFGRVRARLRRIGEHATMTDFRLPWEDVAGAALQAGHAVRKVVSSGVFGKPDDRMLLMERAGVARACAFPVRRHGRVTHAVALYDIYSDAFAPVEQSAFPDFAIAHLVDAYTAKEGKKRTTTT